jgi:hypothetical protein
MRRILTSRRIVPLSLLPINTFDPESDDLFNA